AATVGLGSHVAFGVLGEIAEARGDRTGAEAHYRAALDACPSFTAPVVPLAALHVDAGRPGDAEEVLRVALARQPGNDAARAALAGLPVPELAAMSFEPALGALDELLRAGDADASRTLLAVVERIDVPPTRRRERLARLYLRRGHPTEAAALAAGGTG